MKNLVNFGDNLLKSNNLVNESKVVTYTYMTQACHHNSFTHVMSCPMRLSLRLFRQEKKYMKIEVKLERICRKIYSKSTPDDLKNLKFLSLFHRIYVIKYITAKFKSIDIVDTS